MIATTPPPPYYAVIFSSLMTDDTTNYAETAKRMEELARKSPGFLGFESARDTLGITVSYWRSLEEIKAWKENSEHLFAQEMGRKKWYQEYKTRIARVERDYSYQP